MYRGFQLQIDRSPFTNEELQFGERLLRNATANILPALDSYMNAQEVIDGSRMQEDWFPEIKYDIFISHSHADRAMAVGFAGWLYINFKIKAFVDSCLWGYADDLLHSIDNEYCRNPSGINYNYKKRNNSTAHVHIMLINALSKMIDSSECLFFLKTPSSTVRELIETKTASPWIYQEIAFSALVRKKIPDRLIVHERSILEKSKTFSKDYIPIQYSLNVDHLTKLSEADLQFWKMHRKRANAEDALDDLYALKPLKR